MTESENGKATASPVTMTLEGIEVTIYPMTFKLLGQFELWAEYDLMEKAVAVGGDCNTIPRGPSAMKALIATVRARIQAASISLSVGDKSFTPDKVASMFEDRDSFQEIVDTAFELSFPPKGTGGKSGGKRGQNPF